jgi:hypothetical protein
VEGFLQLEDGIALAITIFVSLVVDSMSYIILLLVFQVIEVLGLISFVSILSHVVLKIHHVFLRQILRTFALGN